MTTTTMPKRPAAPSLEELAKKFSRTPKERRAATAVMNSLTGLFRDDPVLGSAKEKAAHGLKAKSGTPKQK